MRVVFISQRLKDNVCSKVHLNALKDILDENELLILDLDPCEDAKIEKNRIYLGKFKNKEKIGWITCQTTWYLSCDRIRRINSYIYSFNADAVFIDDACLGMVVKQIHKRFPQIRIVTFYHDIVADLYNQPGQVNNLKFKILMDYSARKGENLSQKYSDVNLVLNQRDGLLFKKYYQKDPTGYLPMAVEKPQLDCYDAEEFNFNIFSDTKKIILFVGAIYKPNIEGLQWFVDNVFCSINSNYYLVVIGRGLENLKNEYRDVKNMIVIGGVNSLAPYYNHADVVVAPIFSGGGMKQKTAEAFAYGKTFVGTTESLQGYEDELPIIDNNKKIVFSCDTAEDQLSAFKYIEDNNVYGFHPELFDSYKKKYSIDSLKKMLMGYFG